MKIIAFLLAIIIGSFVMTIIDANEGRKQSSNLLRERLLDSLLEAKRLGLLYNRHKDTNENPQNYKVNRYEQESDEDHNGRTFARRKVVGISDNWF